MNTPNGGDASASKQRRKLPVNPSLEHLQKQAKRRVKLNSSLQLATAQHQLAREYGCTNWTELARIVTSMAQRHDSAVGAPREFGPLPKAARAVEIGVIREVLTGGDFTQHDLNQALAHALWYQEKGTWQDRKAIADLLVEHGADPDAQYGSGGYGPIVFGTGECLNPAGLQYLIDAGADVTFPPVETKYGIQCPLSYWLGTYGRGNNDRKHRGIEILLKHGAYIPPEVTPPILAIHRGDAAGLAELLDTDSTLISRRFADLPYGNMQLRGATLLHCAVEFGELECAEELFKRYADINEKADVIDGVGGQTPVFHAIDTNSATLEYLVKRVGQWMDMSVRATWKDGAGTAQTIPMTPLEYGEKIAHANDTQWENKLNLLRTLDRKEQIKAAILSEDEKVVARLLDERPDLLTSALWPPAIFQAKSLAITRLLLDRGLNPNECSAPRKPLHFAVDGGLPHILRELLAAGADPNIKDGEGFTPLDLYGGLAQNTDPGVQREIVTLLRDAGTELNVWTAMRIGDTESALDQLAANTGLIHTPSADLGFLPLHVAARMAHARIVAWLLEHGADVNAGANTPLWFACQSGAAAENRLEVAKLLIDAGADINRRCEDGTTALHFAAWRGPAEVVELLLSHGARNWIADDKGKLPCDYAQESEMSPDKTVIVELFDKAESAENPDQQVIESVLGNDLPSLRRLLDRHPQKIVLTGGPWNKPLLHCAAWEGHFEIIRELVKRGADVNARCESDHACPIHFAAERGHLEIVRFLAEAGSDIEAGDNDHQLNVLGWATSLGSYQEDVARFLLSRGAKMSIWSAIALNDAEKTRSLITADPALVRAQMSRNEYFRSPLHHAVARNRPVMVRLLLELGADPNARDAMGLSVLGSGNADTDPEILTLLEARMDSPNLHDALTLGRFDQAAALLAEDPDCIKPGGSETRLFVYAVCRKNWSAAEWLLDHGADINATTEVYQCPATALHFAIECAPTERIQWLLDRGADATIPDGVHHADALGWAEFFGKSDIAEMMREYRAAR